LLASDRTCEARRVWRDLLADGADCGLHRIERLMPLHAQPRRRRLPKDEGYRQIATMPLNILDRQFEAERPN
jgi:putative transposase